MTFSVDSFRTLRSIGLVLGGAFAAACGPADTGAAATTMRDSSGVMIVQHDLTRRTTACSIDTTPRVSIGVEDGEEPYMLARLGGAIRLSDGRIVIANRMTHEIRYFDSTGTWIRSSGRKGQGPGEFSDPFYIQPLRGDTIYVGDFRPFQYLVFDEKGDWVKSVKPDPMELNSPRSMNILSDGRLFNGRTDSFDKLPNFAPRTMVMELYDANGKLTDTVVTLENGRYGRLDDDPQSPYVYPIFESFAQARSRGDRIVIGHASKPELRVQRADPGLPLDRIIRWDVGSRDIKAADVAAFKAAGIAMTECRLLEENGRRHFMTQRFDRTTNGARLHMQSLGALTHFDFNQAGTHSYEQALLTVRQLHLPKTAVEEQFRRMVFNIVARNQGDDVKNIAFLMNRQGEWSLAPAFDVTYSHNPSGLWTATHQMTLNGKRDGFTLADFRACEKSALMKRGRAMAVIDEVQMAVRRWPEFAAAARLSDEWREKIQRAHRVSVPRN